MGIKEMNKIMELEKLRKWFWDKWSYDLYKEAEEELTPKIKWYRWMFGDAEYQVKLLQVKKFEEKFDKFAKSQQEVKK